jgi:hypothetical protein
LLAPSLTLKVGYAMTSAAEMGFIVFGNKGLPTEEAAFLFTH